MHRCIQRHHLIICPQRENTAYYAGESDENVQVEIGKIRNHNGSTLQAVKRHVLTSLFDKEFHDVCSVASQIHKIPGGCESNKTFLHMQEYEIN